jgi:hypothetical protein
MIRLLIIPIFALFCSCSDDIPSCIDDRIDEFKEMNKDCADASIIVYEFQEIRLYGFTDGQCIADGGTTLLTEDCETYCFLGGIAGFIECQGENFFQNASEIEQIWVNN